MLPRNLVLVLLVVAVSGCASLARDRLAANLTHAMLNQEDPATVKAGAAAYLLLLDGMIQDNPKDRSLLIAAARLYGAFATGLVSDRERGKRLTDQSRSYALRALCLELPRVCEHLDKPYPDFVIAVDAVGLDDIDLLYTYGLSLVGWIQVRQDDWNALAELPKVEHIMDKVVALKPDYQRGRAQLVLGVLRTQLPAAMGGKPETGRVHFEKAIAFSGGRDLMAKVEYARRYARLVYDKALHDRLLQEVTRADPKEPELTLSNVLAQQRARELLADGYF